MDIYEAPLPETVEQLQTGELIIGELRERTEDLEPEVTRWLTIPSGSGSSPRWPIWTKPCRCAAFPSRSKILLC